ncbi:DUF938 domain-containing protein [Sulfitobacter sp. D35]|uniref:DUF938 domain-containing protein n=1 Tax=Sulfitobacter sp. D35 TaxID=3083252 RepID=UPI00296E68D5|nr:DUF938 domain-containing protein [Sulfitobacter sp. D35]MDW4499762.1 DUF938 domain-containing protein [Sulfitobacter sp. D35]
MSRALPPQASVANPDPSGSAKLHAPSADRNAEPITHLLLKHAPRSGRALEIASGTGQHVVAFARAMPDMVFQPTDLAEDRLASIDAYVAEARLGNVEQARRLDAATPSWGRKAGAFDLVVLVNLLHLISGAEAETVAREAASAVGPGGILLVYGPFKRNGRLTSEGDVQFDAGLRAADPDIGYKDDALVEKWLNSEGLSVVQVEMPANNLAMVAQRG